MRLRGGISSAFRGRGGAFTLVELLVVIAVIGLLMSILMPALSRARQMAKTVKCTANLKQIGVAMQSYFIEHKDWFPFEKHNYMPEYPWMSGFYYGGHPGDPSWWAYEKPAFRDTPAGRPFNPYIYPGLPDWDVQPDEPQYAMSRNVPVFHCPSDTGGHWLHKPDELNSQLQYVFAGTSYDFNYHFCFSWAIRYYGALGLDDEVRRWQHRSNAFLRTQFQADSSRFVMLYEDPFDSGLYKRQSLAGWHREQDKHTLLFLDSHAAYIKTDTVAGNRGLGWKTGSGRKYSDPEAWWNNPDDPDYQYRDITPLPG